MVSCLKITGSQTIGGTTQNAALFNLKIYADIMGVIIGDLAPNRGRISRLCASRTLLGTVMQYSITFCSRPEAASNVISGDFLRRIVANRAVKFNNPRFNHFRENRRLGHSIVATHVISDN